MKYLVTVPPTQEQGSYSTKASNKHGNSVACEALWHYNSARSRDGLLPIKRMPNGTKYLKIN